MRKDYPYFALGDRLVGESYTPLVIAEIGINHEGSLAKALQMVDDAFDAGCECVKLQTHIVEEEMIPNEIVPANAEESIWEMMKRCQLSIDQEREVKLRVEERGMHFLSTPFSVAAADRLMELGVEAFKIGSGECCNYPLVKYIAGLGKPVILSTGMNSVETITPAVTILRENKIPFALLHCTSIYPTPYSKVRLGAIEHLRNTFPDAVLGLSDHSKSIYPCMAAVALGARILERHFASDLNWPGPDIEISMDPHALKELVTGSAQVFSALGGEKSILAEEQPTIDFAYASVVTTRGIRASERFTVDNIWVKRPGTGEIRAADLEKVVGKKCAQNLEADTQVRWEDIC